MWCVVEGAPVVSLALAKDEASVKLLGLVAAKHPDLIVAASIVAQVSPKNAGQALELLNEHPGVSVETAVGPLFADNNKVLIKLAKSDEPDARALVDALRDRSKAVAEALESKEVSGPLNLTSVSTLTRLRTTSDCHHRVSSLPRPRTPQLLASMLTPAQARAVARYLAATGSDALLAAATEIGESDYVLVPKSK